MPGHQSALAYDDIFVVDLPNWAPPYDGEPGGGDADIGAPRPAALLSGNVADFPGAAAAEPVGDWPRWFARMLTEALAGERAARQVLPCMSNRARSQFSRLLPGFSSSRDRVGGQRARLVRVVATRPASDAIEMSVVARFGPRTRALALRLERPASDARWTCTEIEAA